ncbi:MAG TPA: hypothetical protein VIM14_02700 [Polyangia bacterium]
MITFNTSVSARRAFDHALRSDIGTIRGKGCPFFFFFATFPKRGVFARTLFIAVLVAASLLKTSDT